VTPLGLSGLSLSLGLLLAASVVLPTPVEAATERSGVRYIKSESGIGFYDYPLRDGKERGREEARLGSKAVLEVKGYLAGRNGWNFIDTSATNDVDNNNDDDVVRLTLGKTSAIKGLELGLLGDGPSMPPMHQGDKRRLVIPSRLGYTGDRDQQPVPRSDDNKRRLYSTVLNQQRSSVESKALGGDSVVGELILDVEVVRLRNGK